MTDAERERRIYHHLYETCEGIAQQTERIVALEELVLDMWNELDAATQYDAGGGRGIVYEFADRMRELGIEVGE